MSKDSKPDVREQELRKTLDNYLNWYVVAKYKQGADIDRIMQLITAETERSNRKLLERLKSKVANPTEFMTTHDHLVSRGKLLMFLNAELAKLGAKQ